MQWDFSVKKTKQHLDHTLSVLSNTLACLVLRSAVGACVCVRGHLGFGFSVLLKADITPL